MKHDLVFVESSVRPVLKSRLKMELKAEVIFRLLSELQMQVSVKGSHYM